MIEASWAVDPATVPACRITGNGAVSYSRKGFVTIDPTAISVFAAITESDSVTITDCKSLQSGEGVFTVAEEESPSREIFAAPEV